MTSPLRARILVVVAALTIVAALGAVAVAADGEPLDYSLCRKDGELRIWLDISPSISSSLIEEMRDGVEFAFACRVTLLRPRRLWGAATIAKSVRLFNVGYGIMTEDFYVSYPSSETGREVRFTSLSGLRRYLADSIMATIIATDSLNPDQRYFVKIQVSRLSLTALNLASPEAPEGASSPLHYLFDKFLQFTGFGRKEYTVSSRPFTLSEVEVAP